MTATCSPLDLCPPSNNINVNCDSSQNLWEKLRTEILLSILLSLVRVTWTGSEDTGEEKLCLKEGCLVCLALTAFKWVEKKWWQQEKELTKSPVPYVHMHTSLHYLELFKQRLKTENYPRKRESPTLHDFCLHSNQFLIPIWAFSRPPQ